MDLRVEHTTGSAKLPGTLRSGNSDFHQALAERPEDYLTELKSVAGSSNEDRSRVRLPRWPDDRGSPFRPGGSRRLSPGTPMGAPPPATSCPASSLLILNGGSHRQGPAVRGASGPDPFPYTRPCFALRASRDQRTKGESPQFPGQLPIRAFKYLCLQRNVATTGSAVNRWVPAQELQDPPVGAPRSILASKGRLERHLAAFSAYRRSAR